MLGNSSKYQWPALLSVVSIQPQKDSLEFSAYADAAKCCYNILLQSQLAFKFKIRLTNNCWIFFSVKCLLRLSRNFMSFTVTCIYFGTLRVPKVSTFRIFGIISLLFRAERLEHNSIAVKWYHTITSLHFLFKCSDAHFEFILARMKDDIIWSLVYIFFIVLLNLVQEYYQGDLSWHITF